jgi:very-short-patch-repair endonuclease
MKVTGEQAVELILAGHKIEFIREYRFNSARRWRADFCIPQYKILIEVMGGTWTSGKHSRGKGQRNDYEKNNSAVMLGYNCLYYTSDMIRDNPGQILTDVLLCIEGGNK